MSVRELEPFGAEAVAVEVVDVVVAGLVDVLELVDVLDALEVVVVVELVEAARVVEVVVVVVVDVASVSVVETFAATLVLCARARALVPFRIVAAVATAIVIAINDALRLPARPCRLTS